MKLSNFYNVVSGNRRFCITNRSIVEGAKLMTAMEFWHEYRNSRVWSMEVEEVHASVDRDRVIFAVTLKEE